MKKDIIGSVVKDTIDRPLGSAHPKYLDMIYTLNYGYVYGVIAGDGEEQDVYVIGSNKPLERFEGKMIAIGQTITKINGLMDEIIQTMK